MTDTEYMSNDTVEIDDKKLKRMINRIYYLERKNSKTSSLTEKEMRIEIQKIIEEEAGKCY